MILGLGLGRGSLILLCPIAIAFSGGGKVERDLRTRQLGIAPIWRRQGEVELELELPLNWVLHTFGGGPKACSVEGSRKAAI